MGITERISKHTHKMPLPLNRIKIKKKRTNRFERHQCDRKIAVKPNWRKPKGIDSRVRRRFKGTIRMPKIGYGNNKKTRFLLPSGFYKFVVHNVSELDMLLMHNRQYAAQIASTVSVRKRHDILRRANQLDIKVVNRHARMRQVEN